MPNKEGKKNARDTLPRSPSQLDDTDSSSKKTESKESKESNVSSKTESNASKTESNVSVTGTGSNVNVSVNISKKTEEVLEKTDEILGKSKEKPSIQFNGDGQWYWYDGLSLSQLNNLLRKYIERVHELESERGHEKPTTESNQITVKIDQTEIKNMKTTFNTTIDEWKVKIGNKDKKIKELEKKVTDLETEVKNLQNSISDKDKIINEKKKTIAELRAEIAKLNGEIACLKSKLATSESNLENFKEEWQSSLKQLEDEKLRLQNRISEITVDYTGEKNKVYDLKFKIDSLERDLKLKIGLLSSELEVWKNRTQSSTQIGITASEREFRGIYDDRLQEQLSILRKIYEQHMRDSKSEMEMMYIEKVNEYERTKSSTFEAEILSNKTQIKFLTRQMEEYKRKYEELWAKNNLDVNEVRVYNTILRPEWERTSKKETMAQWSSYASSGSSGQNGDSGTGEGMKTGGSTTKTTKAWHKEEGFMRSEKFVEEKVTKHQGGSSADKKSINE